MTLYIIWHYNHYSYRAQHHLTIPTFQRGFLASFPGEVDRFQHDSAGTKGDLRSSRQTFLPGRYLSKLGKLAFFFWDAGFLKREVDPFLEFAWDYKLFRTWDLRFVFGQILSVLAFFFGCVFFFAETIALYFFCKSGSLFSCCLSGEIRGFYILFTKLVSEIVSQQTWRFLACVQTLAVFPEIGPVGVAELVSVERFFGFNLHVELSIRLT